MSISGCFVISSAVGWCVEESENDNINMPSLLFLSCCLSSPRSLCGVILWGCYRTRCCYLIGNGKAGFVWPFLRGNWSAALAFLNSQLDQIPAFAFPITFLMCPLWDYDICGADSHKSATSEIKETGLLMSPWLKLLHRFLFAASSLSRWISIICLEK